MKENVNQWAPRKGTPSALESKLEKLMAKNNIHFVGRRMQEGGGGGGGGGGGKRVGGGGWWTPPLVAEVRGGGGGGGGGGKHGGGGKGGGQKGIISQFKGMMAGKAQQEGHRLGSNQFSMTWLSRMGFHTCHYMLRITGQPYVC